MLLLLRTSKPHVSNLEYACLVECLQQGHQHVSSREGGVVDVVA